MKGILKLLAAVVAIGVFGWLAFGFFGIQALWTNREVEEEIPDSVSELISQPAGAAGTGLVGTGLFEQGDSTYTIAGNVFLSRTEGKLHLTFTDFEVSNGPDLFVYAVKTNSTDNRTVKDTVANGGFVNLGALKGNLGNQSYLLEDEINADEYSVIAIWCRRFSRNFGSAALSPPTSGS